MDERKICVASADGHVGAPTAVYRDYLESWLQPAFDDYYAHHVWRWAPQSKDSYFPAEKNSKFWQTEGFDPSKGTPTAWDSALRLKAMDQSMIACEVLLPDDQNTNDPPWGAGLANAVVEGTNGSNSYEPGLVRAGARAYNRWLAEFCSAAPERLKGLTILGTMEDVVWCVDEVRRAYDSGLCTGVMLPLDYYLPLYHHPRYDILWEQCSELNLSVVVHGSKGHPHYLGDDPWVVRAMYNQEHNWNAQRPVWCFIMGGVLEKFPNLRLGTTELGIDWVPGVLGGFDMSARIWPGMRASRDVPSRINFSLKPSEYWRRQCFVTHSIGQRREEFETEAFERVPNMVFGADLGHDEGWWPVFGFPEPAPRNQPPIFGELPVIPVEEAYRALLGGLPAVTVLAYLQDNFFKAYPNVDREALHDVVERVCPTTTELGLV